MKLIFISMAWWINCRYWAFENPRELPSKPLHNPKVTVWCAVGKVTVIGPYFYEDNDGNAKPRRLTTSLGLNYDENVCLSCSTMWVGCQSRWFLCLFWRETRQRILGPEISPYPEVVRGREWELTTRLGRGQLAAGQQKSEQQRVGVEERTGAVNTGHRSREARQHGIGSSESE